MSETTKIFRISHNMGGYMTDFSEAYQIADKSAKALESLTEAKINILKQAEQSVLSKTKDVKLGDAVLSPNDDGISSFMFAMPDAMENASFTLYEGSDSSGAEYQITLETRKIEDNLDDGDSTLTAYICLVRKVVPETNEQFVLDDTGKWTKLSPAITDDVVADVARLMLGKDHTITDKDWSRFQIEQRPLMDLAQRTSEYMTFDNIASTMYLVPLDPDCFGIAVSYNPEKHVFEINQYVSTSGKYNICIDISADEYDPDTWYMRKVAESDDVGTVEKFLDKAYNRYTNGHAILAVPYNAKEALVCTIDEGIDGDELRRLMMTADGVNDETSYIGEFADQVDRWREESLLEDEFLGRNGTEAKDNWYTGTPVGTKKP